MSLYQPPPRPLPKRMRVHEVVIVPGAGYLSAEGIYTRGHQTDRVTELDVVDQYVRAIQDELDIGSIRHRTLETRKRPGIPEGSRHLGILPGSFVLHCKVSWNVRPPSKPNTTNRSRIFYGPGDAPPVAHLIEEILSHWGTLYVAHEHLCASPVEDACDPLLSVPGCVGLRLEPFALNGPNAELYFTKLEQLGRDIGRGVADYLINNQSHARMRPCTIDGVKLKGPV